MKLSEMFLILSAIYFATTTEEFARKFAAWLFMAAFFIFSLLGK